MKGTNDIGLSMACIVRSTDKRSGITYVYRSESYWDKEKKAPRNKRELIGKVDPVTNEIVPTDGRRRNKMNKEQIVASEIQLPHEDINDDYKKFMEQCLANMEKHKAAIDEMASLLDNQKNVINGIMTQMHDQLALYSQM